MVTGWYEKKKKEVVSDGLKWRKEEWVWSVRRREGKNSV